MRHLGPLNVTRDPTICQCKPDLANKVFYETISDIKDTDSLKYIGNQAHLSNGKDDILEDSKELKSCSIDNSSEKSAHFEEKSNNLCAICGDERKNHMTFT